MVMSTPPGNDETTLRRLIKKARRLAGLTPEDRQLIAAMREQAQHGAVDMCLDPLPTPNTPPQEFIEILRLPEGDPARLIVTIDGHRIPLVLNPRGEADPPREAELWNWLLERVRQEAG